MKISLKKHFLFTLIVIIHFFSYSQKQVNNLKKIQGIVTHSNYPLSNADITIKNSNKGTKTNNKGEYSLTVKIGDIVEYSYIGLKSKSIIIEDVTNVLNIELVSETNFLDKITITASKNKSTILKKEEKKRKKFNSAFGVINPEASGSAIHYVDGEKLNQGAQNIAQALSGRVSGLYFSGDKATIRGKKVKWDVDGAIQDKTPTIDISQVKDIYVMKKASVAYGTDRSVIIIRTNKAPEVTQSKREEIAEQYTNQNYYNNDADTIFEDKTPNYINKLIGFNKKEHAYNFYEKELKKELSDYDSHVSIAESFLIHYNDKNIFFRILDSLSIKNHSNAEILKAIAYQYQNINEKKKAIKQYEKIYYLRPTYAQSYRDLANAYLENSQYKKAWRLYLNYLAKKKNSDNSEIEKIIFNEMEWLYYLRNNQTQIKQKFQPINKSIDEFRRDIRIVFEWNTSEAEFDLEFVSPDKRAFSFEHNLEKDEELIIDEKTKGYSSKEFFIKDIETGEWLINLKYYGNKKTEASFLKATIYLNWGKSNQTKKNTIFKLKNIKQKTQLYKLDNKLLSN